MMARDALPSTARGARKAPDDVIRTRPFGTDGPPVIRHFVAGGTEHGGGIGRLVGYVLSDPNTSLEHSVVDTRGPRWRPFPAALRLSMALAGMVMDRVRARPVLCHFHIAGRGSTARKAILGAWARCLGLRYVLHLHDYDYEADLLRRPAWQCRIIRDLFCHAAQVIVLGYRDETTVRDRLGVAPGRITVLRNCVPAPIPAPVGRDPGRPVEILFLGQLGPRKGVPELIAALADPAMPQAGWRAILAGDGPTDTYRAEIARRGLSDRVSLSGWVGAEAAAALRAHADILVLPSHAEGFAMAVLEGLAQGIAVVTTRVGAHDEVLEDGRTCLLVAPGDITGLAHALARLVADPALRHELGAEGQALYRSRFRIEEYVQALERLHVRLHRTAALAEDPA
ncbi:glycosyltransferase involved in cell wall biosynthesis [Limimaricola variabilis]|uniref:Glycosyltransferase involved in cell wall biosynthesis n=1 Tax=Limimaricola variabilis TaxID=1492771 RepID=A0ABR6HJV5_9RHOB|nr:glycosyltransferase family 4 protein [Limimaricola variabilis]MBB3710835.1 glycosyltransferase involved in cell wall biosynthesis [Limimaricola variabilis]